MLLRIDFQTQIIASYEEQKGYKQSNKEQKSCIQCEDGHKINIPISECIEYYENNYKYDINNHSFLIAEGEESDVADRKECK